MLRLLLTSALLLALGGCASTPPAAPAKDPAPAAAAAEVPEPPERAFPAASLYPLLLAEFACAAATTTPR